MPHHDIAAHKPVCLTDDERQLLVQIYRTRVRFFASVFLSLFTMAVIYGSRMENTSNRYEAKDTNFSTGTIKLIGITWLALPILATGAFIFFKRVYCFRKDIKDGHKYPVYYVVINKLYFPLTDQYFISLDDPDYLHHEVDAALYQHMHIDDVFPVYNARYSRYAFNKNGSFTII